MDWIIVSYSGKYADIYRFSHNIEFASLSEKCKGKVLFIYTCWLLDRLTDVIDRF
jgi:hypothetical protein